MDSRKHYLSSDCLSEMIQLLGRHVLLDIELGLLTANEATDISNKERFAIVIRWVDNALIYMKTLLNLLMCLKQMPKP